MTGTAINVCGIGRAGILPALPVTISGDGQNLPVTISGDGQNLPVTISGDGQVLPVTISGDGQVANLPSQCQPLTNDL